MTKLEVAIMSLDLFILLGFVKELDAQINFNMNTFEIYESSRIQLYF